MERASAVLVVMCVVGRASMPQPAAAQPRFVPLPLPPAYSTAPSVVAPAPEPSYPSYGWQDPYATLTSAETRASPGARRVLETVRTMLDDATVVRGSCFDWVDAVYHHAGGHWHDAYHGHGHEHGPYADPSQLLPGDWVFFVNHEFGDDTHSAVFVGWSDERAHVATMVSYAGGHRDEPGRFGEYTLTSVFRIVRMIDEPPGDVSAAPHLRHHG